MKNITVLNNRISKALEELAQVEDTLQTALTDVIIRYVGEDDSGTDKAVLRFIDKQVSKNYLGTHLAIGDLRKDINNLGKTLKTLDIVANKKTAPRATNPKSDKEHE